MTLDFESHHLVPYLEVGFGELTPVASPAEAVLDASVAASLSPSAAAAVSSVAADWSCPHPSLHLEDSEEPVGVAVSLEHFG